MVKKGAMNLYNVPLYIIYSHSNVDQGRQKPRTTRQVVLWNPRTIFLLLERVSKKECSGVFVKVYDPRYSSERRVVSSWLELRRVDRAFHQAANNKHSVQGHL